MAGQYTYELEGEYTPLHEFESEADPFFGRIARGLRGLVRRVAPLLRRLAPIAARIVGGAIPGVGAIAGPLAGQLASALTREQQQQLEAILHEATIAHESGEFTQEFEGEGESFHPEGEREGEGEGLYAEGEAWQHEFEGFHPEWHPEGEGIHPESERALGEFEGGLHMEGESELPGQSHPEMHPEREAGIPHSEAAHLEAELMEQIAHEASVTASEADAEALVGSLVPMVLRPPHAPAIALRAASPALSRATGRLTWALRRSPATRPLIRTVPTILRRTRASLARSAAQGTPISPRTAVRTMAGHTYRVFANPNVCIQILVRSGRLCQRCR
jgi:hypothetical protein